MSVLYAAYPTTTDAKMENGINGAIVAAADATAALAALKANKPNGSTDDAKLALWSITQIAATAGTLPGGATVIWTGGMYAADGLARPGQ